MKLSIQQTAFSKALSAIARIVPTNPSHPILANALLAAEGGALRLTGFDLSTSLELSAPATVAASGTVAAPAKTLSAIVSKLSGELAIALKDSQLSIESSCGKYTFAAMDAAEYPDLPRVEGEALSMDAMQFAAGIDSVVFAASTDESKQVLQSVRLEVEHGTIAMAATDGHRLATWQAQIEDLSEGFKIGASIPAIALREIRRFLAGGTVKIATSREHAEILTEEGARLTTRLLEGQYPNYKQLIPKSFARSLTVERKLLIGALERALMVAQYRNNIVKLAIAPDTLTITAEAADIGSAQEELPALTTGEALDVAFNGRYMVEGLKAVQSADVLLQCNTAVSPAIITPIGGENQVYLLMPIQIRE